MPRRFRPSRSSLSTLGLGLASCFALNCSSGGSAGGGGSSPPVVGQTEFESAPLPGQVVGSGGSSGGNADAGAALNSSGGASAPSASNDSSASATRTVQETDLYRVSGNFLYYLNSYRGLMVFDISNIDAPRLVGRHEIFGSPIDMVVDNGFAVVIVSDWYGSDQNGAPFYGSIVRGLDVTDPTNIKVSGQAQLGGGVVDSRVVGNVLYTVAENYAYSYGWGIAGGGIGGGGSASSDVVVTSVSFAGNTITPVGQKTFTGYSGVINVNANSIMLAHDLASDGDYYSGSGKSELQYIDISDPGGNIVLGGTMQVPGDITGWGADNGRWNLDFADQKLAHVVTQAYDGTTGAVSYQLSTVDFTTPTAPTLASTLTIPTSGWSPTARFDTGRMYLAPDSGYWDGSNSSTPIQIYDLTSPTSPKLAGQTTIDGSVWLFMPTSSGTGATARQQLFALGNGGGDDLQNGAAVALNYLDVTDEAAPTVLGTSTFGSGWAWSPAATTFKAFTLDTTQGLVAIPFSGWSANSDAYNNGVQLIEFTPSTLKTDGAARTHGWVERGIFVNGRLLSLSDLALTVSNYTDRANPQVVNEITLARNVVDATPDGTTVAELSTDWWGYDTSSTQMRVLPLGQATESSDVPGAATTSIPGSDARVYRNGTFAYVVSDVNVPAPCAGGNGIYPGAPVDADGGAATCTALTTQVNVVDLSNGGAKLRGSLTLPLEAAESEWGYEWFDWYGGTDEVQVGGSILAFRHWDETYNPDGTWTADQKMYILDASNPDAPAITSTTIAPEQNDWWGNMQVVGTTLYTNHYEWDYWPTSDGEQGRVRYYLDELDLSNPSKPRVGRSFNVPGLLVGGNPSDPTELYTIDYRWDGDHPKNELDVIKVDEGSSRATLVSRTPIGGWVGSVYSQGEKLYTTISHYDWDTDPYTGPTQQLLQIDVTNPSQPALTTSASSVGWGWLLGLAGDRALVSSGWAGTNVDVYHLGTGAPTYEQTIRTNGWDVSSVKRQGNTLYLATGYWGVQTATLE